MNIKAFLKKYFAFVIATLNYVIITRGTSNGDIRLVGGETPFAGWVEIFSDGIWGNVCSDGWGWDEAEITCKQLGYPGAMFHGSEGVMDSDQFDVTAKKLDCDGNEDSLSDCIGLPSDCDSIATVTCFFSGYIGCMEDCVNKILCSGYTFKEMSNIKSIQECLDICRNQNYLYAALSEGDTCSCGNDLYGLSRPKSENEACSIECAGDSSQVCGGKSYNYWALLIRWWYEVYGVFSTSVGECGGELFTSHGVIYSPGFPGNYSPSVNCYWIVSMLEDSEDDIIQFELSMLGIDKGDQLVLNDSCNERKEFQQINQTALPLLFNLTSPVSIKFHSTTSSSNLGFVLNYRAFEEGPGCKELPELENGEFQPNWSKYYPGDFVFVLCDPGLIPSVYEIKCLEDLIWSGYPNCTNSTALVPELSTLLSLSDSLPPDITTTQTTSTNGNGTGSNAASSQDSSIAGTAVGVVIAVLMVVGGLIAFIYVYRRRSNAQAVKNLQKLALAHNSSVNCQADPRYDRVPANDLTQPTQPTSSFYDRAAASSPNGVLENGGEEEHYDSQPGPGRDGAVDDDSSVYYSEMDPKITANMGAKTASYAVVRPKSKLAGTQGEATDGKRADTQGDFVDNLLYSIDAGPSENAAAQDDGKLPSGNGFADNVLYQPSSVTPDGDLVENVIYHGAESEGDTLQKLQPSAGPTGDGPGDHQKQPVEEQKGFVDNLLYQASSGSPDEDFVDNTIYQPVDE